MDNIVLEITITTFAFIAGLIMSLASYVAAEDKHKISNKTIKSIIIVFIIVYLCVIIYMITKHYLNNLL